MFSSKTLQLFLSMTAFAAISSPMSVLAAPRQSKSSKNKKSSKSAPPLPIDMLMCEGLGDPVYTPPPVPQPIFPSELVRTMTTTKGAEIVVKGTTGIVDVNLPVPSCGAFGPTSAYPDDAVWCNAEEQAQFRITVYTTCLHSMTDEYYYIKYVKTQADTTSGASGSRSSTGECTLVRVSRQAPGTWTEYQTPEMDTTGGAIEWVYDTEPVGLRYKFSLCPNPEDENKVYPTNATFAV